MDSAYAAAEDADALLILNDWQEFAELDLAKLHYTLRYPIVIDGRNLYDPATMNKAGFTYLSVGRPGSGAASRSGGCFFSSEAERKRQRLTTEEVQRASGSIVTI